MTQHVFLVTDSKGRILEGVEGRCIDCTLQIEGNCIYNKSGLLLCKRANNQLKKWLTFRDTGKRMPGK
jgi:hypothetical protein